MIVTRSEIGAVGRCAARGVGYPWGIAEEAGHAARWLADRGLPGAQLLAGHLNSLHGLIQPGHAPESTEGIWRAPMGVLCPLLAGAALSDLGARVVDGQPVTLGRVAFPLLLAPYAALIARAGSGGEGGPLIDLAIELAWADARVVVDASGRIETKGDPAALAAPATDRLVCRRSTRSIRGEQPAAILSVDPESWHVLEALADRLLAPVAARPLSADEAAAIEGD